MRAATARAHLITDRKARRRPIFDYHHIDRDQADEEGAHWLYAEARWGVVMRER
ncbi:MAG: hypothetical protein AAF416_14465 [Pseudomonadota bacterium]